MGSCEGAVLSSTIIVISRRRNKELDRMGWHWNNVDNSISLYDGDEEVDGEKEIRKDEQWGWSS